MIAFSHDLAARCIVPGETAVDATMGNGHCTLKLAQLVGPEGRVHAFDVQPQALEATRHRLATYQEQTGDDVLTRTTLHLRSHEELSQVVTGSVATVLFNLGYLPGSDKQITTVSHTTLSAANQALQCIKCHGLLIITVYPGHAQGQEEHRALEQWLTTIDAKRFRVARYCYENTLRPAPYVLAIEKLRED